MAKTDSKFWFGLVLGAVGGVLAAQKTFAERRMPNAKAWQRLLADSRGEIEAAVLMARIEQRYRELLTRRPNFENPVYDTHVKGNILSGLAFYQILREDGLDPETAIAEINTFFEDWVARYPSLYARTYKLANYLPQNFALFRQVVKLTTDKIFPAPGWQYEIVADDEKTFAFNFHHCFYIEILKYYDAPELTPVFCKLDDYLMEMLPPSLKWGRTQTIGMGAEYCDFRWDYVPIEKIETQN